MCVCVCRNWCLVYVSRIQEGIFFRTIRCIASIVVLVIWLHILINEEYEFELPDRQMMSVINCDYFRVTMICSGWICCHLISIKTNSSELMAWNWCHGFSNNPFRSSFCLSYRSKLTFKMQHYFQDWTIDGNTTSFKYSLNSFDH